MAVIVLAAVGFLACGFFLFVLFQWTMDPKHKPPALDDAAGETSEKKRPHLVGSRKAPEKDERFCGPGCHECERNAYEKVVRSFRSGKRA